MVLSVLSTSTLERPDVPLIHDCSQDQVLPLASLECKVSMPATTNGTGLPCLFRFSCSFSQPFAIRVPVSGTMQVPIG